MMNSREDLVEKLEEKKMGLLAELIDLEIVVAEKKTAIRTLDKKVKEIKRGKAISVRNR